MKIVAVAFLLSLAAFPVLAEDTTNTSGLSLNWTPVPVLTSADGKLSIKLKGRVFLDHGWINDADNTTNLNATEFRAARIGIDGQYGKKFSFRFTADFAHKMVVYKDIYIAWRGPVEIKGGHFRLGASLEGTTSTRFIPLMERASYIEAFGFGRQFGLAFTKSSDKGLAALGIFQGGFAGSGDHTGFALIARITRAPRIGAIQLHFGASFRYRTLGDNESDFRYRARPYAHLSPRFIDTGQISDADTFVGLEGGIFKGAFGLNGEVGVLKADLAQPSPGQANPTFWGGFINVSYFLTGEAQPYNAEQGTMDRPKVKRPVLKGGPGAVQLSLRYDHMDLTDNDTFGGIQSTVIIGFNWWIANHIKLALNYSHAKVTQAFLVPADGPDGANKINAIGLRTQIDW